MATRKCGNNYFPKYFQAVFYEEFFSRIFWVGGVKTFHTSDNSRVNSVVLYNSREWKYHHSVVLYNSPESKVLPLSCVV